MKQRVLHGRDEHGFVIGSAQAEQFQRILARMADDPGSRERARELRKRAKLKRALERPDWWSDRPTHDVSSHRRHWARARAKRAAEVLGVRVPGWALYDARYKSQEGEEAGA